MELISVIIPTFNRAHVLERAIESVLNQTYSNLELIIVDDGSTDSTSTLLEKYQTDERVRVLKTENRGVSSARNRGFKISSGSWIALLDSDDEWLDVKLEKQMKLAKEKPDCPLVHGEEIWVRKGKRVNPKFKHQKFGGRIYQRCLPLCLISPSATLMKRELYSEMEGFREDFVVCEDYELWLRVTSKYPVAFVEDPILIKYGGHDDQLSAKYRAMDIWRIRAMVMMLESKSLGPEDYLATFREIEEKARILKIGATKHQNRELLDELSRLEAETMESLRLPLR